MKRIITAIALPILFILAACAGTAVPDRQEPAAQLLELEGVVEKAAGTELFLSLKMPAAAKKTDSALDEIASQVVRKCLLVEGTMTDVNGTPATVKEIRGTSAALILQKPALLQAGSKVRLGVPKKTIAVADFEVIRGQQKEAGRVTLEGLTSALIETGHFTVVERSKLRTVLNELQLSASGLTKETPEKVIGKLYLADLILTGTLAEAHGEWDINLRVINVRTGQAHAAVALKTRLFKPTEIRDAGPWMEDFETSAIDPSWQIMYRRTGRGSGKEYSSYRVGVDRGSGAEGTGKSLKIEFDYRGDRRMYAHAENRKKRDLSLYEGVEFQARATERIVGQLNIFTSLPEDKNKIDNWTAYFEVDKDWQKVRIPFDKLVVARGWIKGGAARYGAVPGDQVLRLYRVEALMVGIDSIKNPETKGAVWIDKIRFYGD